MWRQVRRPRRPRRRVATIMAMTALTAILFVPSGPLGREADRRQAPEPAPPPGAKLEVTAAQTKLMASPPGLLSDVPARLHNAFGTAQRGARLVLVMATEDFYKVAVDCQDGKLHVEGWVDRNDVRPAGAGAH